MHPTKGIDNHEYRVFGKRYPEGIHLGVDIGCYENTPVYAAYKGKVIISGQFNGYGGLNPSTKGGAIWIQHKGFYTHYGHLNCLVNEGDNVDEGELIGYIKRFKNGSNFLPHLHYGKFIGKTIPLNHWGYGDDIGEFVDPFK